MDIRHFHPSRTTPRRTHHFEVRINSKNLFKNGDDIIHLVRGEREIFNAFGIAAGVIIIAARIKIAAANRNAHIAVAHSIFYAERLFKQLRSSFGRHPQQVVRARTSDSSSKAIKRLIALIRIDCKRLLRLHIESF